MSEPRRNRRGEGCGACDAEMKDGDIVSSASTYNSEQ
ncbi:hypothetical protein BACCAP_02955 [Pseudoflavonifractor capillosus ATCC 29799]|uniref:Uncharacterized protein n=1 Tax=Pseudoflavonifractor capillosus ATCC 29799 TaxID=411467 RepID=A6NXK9_9FIRM|nr:hypothetical protein BACCAP_02955 [Pseudoflavonifractor capillosus ATCC 29799]